MNQDRTVNKLMLNINEFNLDVRKALEQAYAAGFDERAKDYNQSQEKQVIQEDINHKKVKDYPSMAIAYKTIGMSKSGMISAIKNKLLTRKGYYFRYSEN